MTFLCFGAVAILGYLAGYVHATHRAYSACQNVEEVDRLRTSMERFPFG